LSFHWFEVYILLSSFYFPVPDQLFDGTLDSDHATGSP